jgi:hypothetical protein
MLNFIAVVMEENYEVELFKQALNLFACICPNFDII